MLKYYNKGDLDIPNYIQLINELGKMRNEEISAYR